MDIGDWGSRQRAWLRRGYTGTLEEQSLGEGWRARGRADIARLGWSLKTGVAPVVSTGREEESQEGFPTSWSPRAVSCELRGRHKTAVGAR